jgi:hypothetical protein
MCNRFARFFSDYTNGSRRMRGFNDHKAALTEAERIARTLSAGEAISASMRNLEAASYGRAVELLRPTGVALMGVGGQKGEGIGGMAPE